jgi:hypothetical protein
LVISSLNPSQLVNLFTSVGLASFLIIVSLSVSINLSGPCLVRIPLRRLYNLPIFFLR